MRKADRLFQLVNLICRQQSLSTAKLAEQVQVLVRSICAISTISQGREFLSMGSRGLGYHLQPGFELPHLLKNWMSYNSQ